MDSVAHLQIRPAIVSAVFVPACMKRIVAQRVPSPGFTRAGLLVGEEHGPDLLDRKREMGLIVAVLNEVRGVGCLGVPIIKQVGLPFGQSNPLFEEFPDGLGVLDHPHPPQICPEEAWGWVRGMS